MEDIKTCEDIDECTAKRPCDVNGLCMNTQEKLSCDWVWFKMNYYDRLKLNAFKGSFMCKCNKGFSGDGQPKGSKYVLALESFYY